MHPQLGIRRKPDFNAGFYGERYVRHHRAGAGREVRRTTCGEREVRRDGLGQDALTGRLVARYVAGITCQHNRQWILHGENLLQW